MSDLISGKDAWIAKADKKDVQYKIFGLDGWQELTDKEFMSWDSSRFLAKNTAYSFRRKPHTITINGVEIRKPASIVKVGDSSISIHFDSQAERTIFLREINNVDF